MAFKGKFREFMMNYGKVAMGVHFSVSTASITGLYIAIKNNIDVESFFNKVGITGVSSKDEEEFDKIETSVPPPPEKWDGFVVEERQELPYIPLDHHHHQTMLMNEEKKEKKNRTAELATSSGGALALAALCNKVLLPVGVPITFFLTPPIARFLARRRISKNHGS
ncbi:protein of unknown function DUF1279 [Macleaya cordata]|uniref:DUF1279 domain-containing protein n=1 Tax=Macleaya cordata TaxID=56857 RepID=A0A200Q020_MACCD|nr:protein of unknown function DUF1279 [Macleaya cordata]